MTIKDEHNKYIANGNKVSYSKFYTLMKKHKGDVGKTIEAIENSVKRGTWRAGKTKANPKEVAEFSFINSVKRAAKVYGYSLKQVYRLREKYQKEYREEYFEKYMKF